MGQGRYEEVVANPTLFLALTSLTVEEFNELLEPFETAFRAHMAEWTLEGKRRQNRAYVSYVSSPLPTACERLLFILSYLKENPTQTYHGLLYGMTQPKVNLWVHTLFAALRAALRRMGDAPARSFSDLMARLDEQLAGDDPPASSQEAPPLLPTTALSAPSRARATTSSSSSITAARSAATRSKTSS